MPGADDCWTDHHLISRLDIKIHCPPKWVSTNIPCRCFHCAKLQNSQTSQDSREPIERHPMYLPEPTSIKDCWTSLREIMTAAAKKDQNWFDENDEIISHL
uniref:Uncharacterized protein n=1 Tax=Octopus bimaculoides TaxID=37653 RepID=A0A0L8GM70_OCTBM